MQVESHRQRASLIGQAYQCAIAFPGGGFCGADALPEPSPGESGQFAACCGHVRPSIAPVAHEMRILYNTGAFRCRQGGPVSPFHGPLDSRL